VATGAGFRPIVDEIACIFGLYKPKDPEPVAVPRNRDYSLSIAPARSTELGGFFEGGVFGRRPFLFLVT
jgi:hypothetical protein